jgi:hypothetical protein
MCLLGLGGMRGLLALAALFLATNLRAADLPPRDPPTCTEVAYGPHTRNVLDFCVLSASVCESIRSS